MVKVHTSKIDEQQQPSKAHKIPRGANGLPLFGDKSAAEKSRPYDAQRNADDGVDYDLSLSDFLDQAESLTHKKRLNAVFIELGGTLVPWYAIRSLSRTERYNASSMQYEFGIVINRDTMASEGDNISEWWVNATARDDAWYLLRQQLVELGITIVSAKV